MRKILSIIVLFLSLSTGAQKIVFTEPYSTKNISIDKIPSGKFMEDSVTGQKVLVVSAGRDVGYYLFDANWKLLKKFSKPAEGSSILTRSVFNIIKYNIAQDKWSFVGRTYANYNRETIDFATQSHQVQANIIPDMAGVEKFFVDEGRQSCLYYTRDGLIKIYTMGNDLKPTSVLLRVSTQLPLAKSTKYEPKDYARHITLLNDRTVSYAFLTKKKAQFYVLKNSYGFLLSYDEPVAEMSWYDKTTGQKLKSKLFSLEDVAKGKDFNTAAIYYDEKVYVFAASKSGGVLGVFDPETGKRLYSFTYQDNDDKSVFSYGPVMYQTRPVAFSGYNIKEKVEDISMDKFCKEMYKHSVALTAEVIDKYGLVIAMANYDEKELLGPSTRDNVVRIVSSPEWIVSSSVGLLFEPGTFNLLKKKINWNEVNNSNASANYKRPDKGPKGIEEYTEKRAFQFCSQFSRDHYYVAYYYEGQLKIYDEKLQSKVEPRWGID